MRGNPEFMDQEPGFWALVRTLSEKIGYTHRALRGSPKGSGLLKVHTAQELAAGLSKLSLDPELVLVNGVPTELGVRLVRYFAYRAEVLTDFVQHNLMSAAEAKELFLEVQGRVNPPFPFPLPMNKQKGEMFAPAFLTGLVNMLVHDAIGDAKCNYSPGQLTTFTRDGVPLRTLARRVDGAFPGVVNPVAVWEIKEYYYTTSFGSRVADGVYETLLDGLELDELFRTTGSRADHVLVVDAHYTWWICGKSYLCRIIDMLQMGLVSEVVFGREVVDRIPVLARKWLASV